MFRPVTKTALRLRAVLPIALAYLLAINGVLGGFGTASGQSIDRDQGSSFANVICAAAAAASDIGGDAGAPGKAHTHQAHHCVLCGVGTHGSTPGHSVILPAFAPLPERLPRRGNTIRSLEYGTAVRYRLYEQPVPPCTSPDSLSLSPS